MSVWWRTSRLRARFLSTNSGVVTVTLVLRRRKHQLMPEGNAGRAEQRKRRAAPASPAQRATRNCGRRHDGAPRLGSAGWHTRQPGSAGASGAGRRDAAHPVADTRPATRSPLFAQLARQHPRRADVVFGGAGLADRHAPVELAGDINDLGLPGIGRR